MALAYAAGLLVLLQRSVGVKIQAALAPAGRMALTNSLLQTVICTSLFYAYGLGLYGQVGATQAAVIAVAVFALQVVFSHLWLRAFRFGPVEWLWRMATYWRVLPLRRGWAELADRAGRLAKDLSPPRPHGGRTNVLFVDPAPAHATRQATPRTRSR